MPVFYRGVFALVCPLLMVKVDVFCVCVCVLDNWVCVFASGLYDQAYLCVCVRVPVPLVYRAVRRRRPMCSTEAAPAGVIFHNVGLYCGCQIPRACIGMSLPKN